MQHTFVRNDKEEQLVALAAELANDFAGRADTIDREGVFPFENIEKLKQAGYTKLTVPKEYGGEGISLYKMILCQERLAQGDASTALSIGWHVGILLDLAEKRPWQEYTFKEVCEAVVEQKALLNSAVSEKATGSPTRGGKPGTTAVKKGRSWVINGRKTFTTMSPVLDYFIVVATIQDTGEVAQFLVKKGANGLQIDETWDTMAMRGTGSHDVVLQNVTVPEEHLLQVLDKTKKQDASGWLLHIPACYMGVALAAREYAVKYANSYSPNSISGTISELPNIRSLIGTMELEIMQARHFMYAVADRWDQQPEQRHIMHSELGAVKHAVTNTALSVVDKAMRIVGAQSLYQSNPLQRYYRDVRAGLHNPPMDDAVISMLAKNVLNN
ncbi:acyl-CoA dehydrogenase [Bacillus sp. HMF5848]|uniref:acyl-CoA dehydrogenase family protein n=1 Tax=Bacillus sp. HMF5848 TaxID=2495421 RepID=UPI000F77A54F|nr:acyl-CoA dehydrogenase family protein [Bacillus sp. HMF5848]RSK29091.1 acyl-CoA dehydrogenase [Bacillus sp. HMF5848]